MDTQPTTQWERDMVAKGNCPRCREKSLDTGWECNECGYDAMPIALETEVIQ